MVRTRASRAVASSDRRGSASVLLALVITASGVRTSCEIEASSVLRSFSDSLAIRAASAAFSKPGALQRQRDLHAEALQQLAPLPVLAHTCVAGGHRQQA